MAREVHHNTAEQVRGYLQTSLGIIEGCAVPDDLREAALPLIYNAIASKQIFMDKSEVSGGVLLAAPGVGGDHLQ